MKLASHLRRSRHGVFYFRVTFPKALAELLGQQEIQRSLFTRDPETAKLTGYQLFGSHDGNEYLKKVGVHIPRTKVIHSFRDTVSDALGIPVGIKAKHYRSQTTPDIQARDAFAALDFPFIPFSEFKYEKGHWNDWLKNNMLP